MDSTIVELVKTNIANAKRTQGDQQYNIIVSTSVIHPCSPLLMRNNKHMRQAESYSCKNSMQSILQGFIENLRSNVHASTSKQLGAGGH